MHVLAATNNLTRRANQGHESIIAQFVRLPTALSIGLIPHAGGSVDRPKPKTIQRPSRLRKRAVIEETDPLRCRNGTLRASASGEQRLTYTRGSKRDSPNAKAARFTKAVPQAAPKERLEY